MLWVRRLFFLFVLLALLAVVVIVVGYPLWGRQLLYLDGDSSTLYPGFGQKTEYTKPQIFVNPKYQALPFFAGSNFASEYPLDQYDVTQVPSQIQVSYAVGKFAGWGEVEGSQDKYILITTPEKGKLEKYRVAFEESELFGEGMTIFGTEDVGLLKEKEPKRNILFANSGALLVDMGYDEVRKQLRRGDVVVIRPVLSVPILSKKDDQGNYLASALIVRRVDIEIEWGRMISRLRGGNE